MKTFKEFLAEAKFEDSEIVVQKYKVVGLRDQAEFDQSEFIKLKDQIEKAMQSDDSSNQNRKIEKIESKKNMVLIHVVSDYHDINRKSAGVYSPSVKGILAKFFGGATDYAISSMGSPKSVTGTSAPAKKLSEADLVKSISAFLEVFGPHVRSSTTVRLKYKNSKEFKTHIEQYPTGFKYQLTPSNLIVELIDSRMAVNPKDALVTKTLKKYDIKSLKELMEIMKTHFGAKSTRL